MPAKKPHGGKRKGAGRKPGASGAKRPVTVWCSPAEIEHCEALAGTVQEALRRLMRESMAHTIRPD